MIQVTKTELDVVIVFFFQAEDGIRDYKVTGVQTCALPITTRRRRIPPRRAGIRSTTASAPIALSVAAPKATPRCTAVAPRASRWSAPNDTSEIGRAAWRGRGENSVGAGAL